MKWLLLISFTSLFYALSASLTAKRRLIQDRIATLRGDEKHLHRKNSGESFSIWKYMRKAFATVGLKLWSRFDKRTGGNIQDKLANAGHPLNMKPIEWIGFRLFLAMIGFGCGIGVVVLAGGLRGLVILLVLTVLGWMAPEFWLSQRVTERQQQISKGLPNALDLLTVSVEAGLGFDQALGWVAQKSQGSLAEEFSRTLREIQMGSVRAIALQRMAARTGVDEVQSFVSAIVQADKLGTGLAQVLRIQSASLRERHRLIAQERAMKAPIKMLFPLVLFVFPSIFIVILGPAVLHIIHLLSKGGL